MTFSRKVGYHRKAKVLGPERPPIRPFLLSGKAFFVFRVLPFPSRLIRTLPFVCNGCQSDYINHLSVLKVRAYSEHPLPLISDFQITTSLVPQRI